MRKAQVAVVAFTFALVAAAPANATFHIIVIDQMFPGLEAVPGAQYVVLRMEAPFQVAVFGQPLPTFDALGQPGDPFAAFCATPHGACSLPTVSPACVAGDCPLATESNDSRVLVATRWAQDLFCVTADLLAGGSLPYPDGRVCWGDCSLRNDCGDGPVDCLAYGNYTGDNSIFGTPAASPMLGEALVASPDRKNQFIGGGTLLDNALGFSVGTPAPRNFHGDAGALDGLAGDPEGTGKLEADDIDAEVDVVFEAERRCALPAARRGADANLDTRVSAADIVATVRIVSSAS